MPAMTRSRPGDVVGALGDLGTLVPVAAGLVIGIDAGGFFVAFGLGTIAAGVLFGPPMPAAAAEGLAAAAIAEGWRASWVYR
jgi:hypothetical protein